MQQFTIFNFSQTEPIQITKKKSSNTRLKIILPTNVRNISGVKKNDLNVHRSIKRRFPPITTPQTSRDNRATQLSSFVSFFGRSFKGRTPQRDISELDPRGGSDRTWKPDATPKTENWNPSSLSWKTHISRFGGDERVKPLRFAWCMRSARRLRWPKTTPYLGFLSVAVGFCLCPGKFD